jgi:hypothetical protein
MNEQILLRQRHCSKHLVSVDWLEDWIPGEILIPALFPCDAAERLSYASPDWRL